MDVTQNITLQQLTCLLGSFAHDIRLHCSACFVWCGCISAADIAQLIVNDKNNNPTLSLDHHVYSKNQQIRLYDCVKFETNNPLILSEQYGFDTTKSNTNGDIMRKSIITNVSDLRIPILKLAIDQKGLTCSEEEHPFGNNESNDSVDLFQYPGSKLIPFYLSNQRHTGPIKSEKLQMNAAFDSTDYTKFINQIINRDPVHSGFIHSIVRGNKRSSKLFYNISGDYRYCRKIKSHHRRNTVAFVIDIVNDTYAIRCKDSNCDNTVLTWKKIPNRK
jgi:hypothetical protein